MITAFVVREDAAGEPYPYGNFAFEALPRPGDTIVIKFPDSSERHFVQSVAHFPCHLPHGKIHPAEPAKIQITTRTEVAN